VRHPDPHRHSGGGGRQHVTGGRRQSCPLQQAKKNDEEFQPADEAPPGTTMADLTEALQASIEAHQEDTGREARPSARDSED